MVQKALRIAEFHLSSDRRKGGLVHKMRTVAAVSICGAIGLAGTALAEKISYTAIAQDSVAQAPDERPAGEAMRAEVAGRRTPDEYEADEPESIRGWIGSTTLSLDAYVPGSSLGDDDNATGFFDQYSYLDDKDDGTPIFLDLSETDLRFIGEDNAYRFRVQRRSPNSVNDQTSIYFDLPDVVRADSRFWNYRRENLREFPQDSGAPLSSAFASQFNDDTSPRRRFFNRRTGGDIQFTFKAPLFSSSEEPGIIRSLTLGNRYEQRKERRQFRFVLGGSDRTSGAMFDFTRQRAIEQDIDHKILNPHGKLVFALAGTTGVLSFDYDRFTNRQRQITNSTIDSLAVASGQVGAIAVDGNTGLRTVNYLPDSDRYRGSLRLARRFGSRAGLRFDGQWSMLTQESFSGLEELVGFGTNRVRFFGGGLSGDLRLSKSLVLTGFAKLRVRDNDSKPEILVSEPTDERIDRRSEIATGLELTQRIGTGAVSLGWERKAVDRNLLFPLESEEQILAPNQLLRTDTELNTLYAKGRSRIGRRVNLDWRAHLTLGSDTALQTEPEKEYGIRVGARWSSATRPLVLSAFGNLRRWQNKDFNFFGETAGERDNDIQNQMLLVGANAFYTPSEMLSLYMTSTLQRQQAQTDFSRSTNRRFLEPTDTIVDFFLDDVLSYHGTVATVALGGSSTLTENLVLTGSYTFTRSNVDTTGTQNLVDRFTEVQSNIHRLNLGLRFQWSERVRLAARYEYDDYANQRPNRPDSGSIRSEHQQILGVSITYEFQPEVTAAANK